MVFWSTNWRSADLRRSTLAFMAALQHSVLTFIFRCLISCMAFPLDQELQTTGTTMHHSSHPKNIGAQAS